MQSAWLPCIIRPDFLNKRLQNLPMTHQSRWISLHLQSCLHYIDECLEVEEPAVLTLSDLVRFYTSKVQELGAECGKVNATRLKERVQAAFPDLMAYAEGREIYLVPQHEIGGMLSKVKKMDSDA